MKLGDYLAKHAISHKDFADRIGVSAEAIRLYVKGERRPRIETIRAINAQTAGEVTANDFFEAA